MNDEIFIEYKENYIHVRQFGSDSYDISLDPWRRIPGACKAHNCLNILGESTTTEELSTSEAHKHIEIFKWAGVTNRHRIAWVHHGENNAQNVKFIENSLKNRSLVNGGFAIASKKRKCGYSASGADNILRDQNAQTTHASQLNIIRPRDL